ncbi:MAG TPA: LuxR C-terminal-related transcriptional regulator [Bacteroidia bacterium]|nr:LuxR C-terminal-related transcriptional regulator [Bacteroidia bacterium]
MAKLLIIGNFAFGQKAIVSGYLNLDSTWVKKVYISLVSDFNQMYTASNKLIVAEAKIDSNGFFKTTFPASENESLYRLHIIKNGDPISTLIIGSREENHVFFISRHSDLIELTDSGRDRVLSQQDISGGGKSNIELNEFLTALKSDEIRRENLKEIFINVADSSTSPVVGLLAVHSAFGLSSKQKSRINKILDRYDKSNSYGSRIFEEYKPAGNAYSTVLIILILLVFSSYMGIRVFQKHKSAKIKSLLSQRETSIVQLMLEGKSNKEIASTFNIELSTVKTHVNNVYAKLKINDRKELQKYEPVFKSK